MADDKRPYESIETALHFSDRISYRAKKAHDFRWVELKAEAINQYYPDNFGPDYTKRVEDNYLMLAGKAPKHFNNNQSKQATLMDMEQALSKEGIPMYEKRMKYYDTASPIVLSMLGDQQRRDMRFVATDFSAATKNYMKDLQESAINDYYYSKFVQPNEMLSMQKIVQDQGIEDLFSLEPEQRLEIEQAAQEQAKAMSPQDIVKMMQIGPIGVHDKQAQELVDYTIETQRVKFKTDQSFYHSFATGGQVWHLDFVRNKPRYDMVDLQNFYTHSSRGEFFVDGNDLFKRVLYMYPGELWDRFGDELDTKKKLEQFQDIIEHHLGVGFPSGQDKQYEAEGARFMGSISTKDIHEMGKIDLRSEKGQWRYRAMMGKYLHARRSHTDMIKVTHTVFKSRRKMQYILTRNDAGRLVWEYHNEEYKFDRRNGDVERKILWPPEYWECWAIGELPEPMYVRKRRVPHQYPSLEDPWEVNSPYTGGFYFKLNTDNFNDIVAPLDKAKQYIHDVNVTFHRIKEREATDIGKVMLMTMEAKPEGWSWGKLISTVRAIKILPIDVQKSGLSGADLQFFREIDLSNMFDILQRINYLQFLMGKVSESLLSNAARQGATSASTSVTNNLQNIQRSFSMTSNISIWHDEITARLLDRLVYLSRKSIKNGGAYLRYVLSNQSIASIDLDPEIVDQLKIGIKLSSDSNEVDMLEVGKNILAPLIQQGQLGLGTALDVVFAKNRADLKLYASEADLQREMRMQSEQQLQQDMQSRQEELTKEVALLQQNFARVMQESKNVTNLEIADIRADVLRRGNDVNLDGQPDFMEKANRDRELRRETELLKDSRERTKQDQTHQTNMEALRVEREKIKKQGGPKR